MRNLFFFNLIKLPLTIYYFSFCQGINNFTIHFFVHPSAFNFIILSLEMSGRHCKIERLLIKKTIQVEEMRSAFVPLVFTVK